MIPDRYEEYKLTSVLCDFEVPGFDELDQSTLETKLTQINAELYLHATYSALIRRQIQSAAQRHQGAARVHSIRFHDSSDFEVIDIITRFGQSSARLFREASRIRSINGLSHRDSIATRISELVQDCDDDEEMQLRSLREFGRFLRLYLPSTAPSITLTPNGNIYARWRQSETRKVSFEFIGSGQISAAIFSDKKGITRWISGCISIDDVMPTLRVLGSEVLIYGEK